MKKLFIYFSLMLMLLWTSCKEQAPRLFIVHTNDTHSQVDPAPDNDPYTPGEGGVEQRAAIIDAMRAQYPELLYLDAGDMVQGSPYFNVFKGEMEMRVMNTMQLNAATFGNHEFDNGIDFLINMLQQASFPMLSCNLDCRNTPLASYVKEYIVFKHQGVKIGITGITCNPDGLVSSQNIKGIIYSEPVESVNRVTRILKEQGCDLIILLSHGGYENSDERGDRLIATNSHHLDLIIGGHTHTNLEHGYTAFNLDGRPVMITQTGGRCSPIGSIEIEMMEDTIQGSKAQWMVKSIICNKLHPDSMNLEGFGNQVKELVAPYRAQLESKMQKVLGYAPITMTKGKPQSLLGNFTADALRVMGQQVGGKPVDIGIMNNGGLRADITRGDVTLNDLYRVYPFENTLTLIDLKGELLQQQIESLAGRGLEALSGVEVTLKTINNKTIAKKILVNGKPINPSQTYRVASINYLAEGNGGMTALSQGDIHDTGILLRDIMIEYVSQLTAQGQEVKSQLDNRVTQ